MGVAVTSSICAFLPSWGRTWVGGQEHCSEAPLTPDTWGSCLSWWDRAVCTTTTLFCVPSVLEWGWSPRPALTLTWVTSLSGGGSLLTSYPCVTLCDRRGGPIAEQRIKTWGHDANSGARAKYRGFRWWVVLLILPESSEFLWKY